MVSKAGILTALETIQVIIPMSASADDLSGWIGTYSSKETNFVTLKRLTFTKEKDDSIKVHGALVGFPDEVSIGEATAQPYADRRNKSIPDAVLATFSSEKYKPFMVLNCYAQRNSA